jgi:hypothetical protein
MPVQTSLTNRILGIILILLAALVALAVGAAASAVCVVLIPIGIDAIQRIVRLRPTWKEALQCFLSSIPAAVVCIALLHIGLRLWGANAVAALAPLALAGSLVSAYWMTWRIRSSRREVSRLVAHAGELAWIVLIMVGLTLFAVPAYQDYTIRAKGVRACRELELRATFSPSADGFVVDEEARVLLALSSADLTQPTPDLPETLKGWTLVSRPAAGDPDQTFGIQRHTVSRASMTIGATQVHRLGDRQLLEICKVKSLRLIAPEHVLLRENLLDPKKSDVLVNGEDAVAITASDLVDPPVQVRIVRRPFRNAVLISLASVTVSSAIMTVLSGLGSVLLFFGEWLRDWFMTHFVEPLFKKIPWLKPKRPSHKPAEH